MARLGMDLQGEVDMNNFDFPVEKVFAVGFYDGDGVFFYVWERNWGHRCGFPELARGVSHYAVRYSAERGYGEKRVSREEAGRVLKVVGA